MASNIKISTNSADRRLNSGFGDEIFSDDPANTGGAANPSEVSVADINGVLASTNVYVGTYSTAENETGDITVDTPLIYTNTAGRRITLAARNDILINSDIKPAAGAVDSSLSLLANTFTFEPVSQQFQQAPSGVGHVVMAAGVTVDSNGGSISI